VSISYRTSYPGIFLTFEGIEGSGKTTQAQRLFHTLKKMGYSVILTREPGGPPISEKIRKILLDLKNKRMTSLTEVFLYLASRTQHVEELILPALKIGKIVISDRFADASVAYQGAGRRIGEERVNKLNELATLGLKPDLTILIDLPPQEGLKRVRASRLDRIEKETLGFHRRVRQAYLNLARKEGERIKIVDGRLNRKELEKKIEKLVLNFLQKRKISHEKRRR